MKILIRTFPHTDVYITSNKDDSYGNVQVVRTKSVQEEYHIYFQPTMVTEPHFLRPIEGLYLYYEGIDKNAGSS